MLTKLYIGADCIDIQEKINLQYSIGDWREFNSGGANNSFNFKIPLAKLNSFILKNPGIIGNSEEVSAKGNLFVDGLLMLRGKVRITEADNDQAEVMIEGDEWTRDLAKNKLSDLDFSSENFTLTEANVENSWSGADKFYRYPMVNFGALSSGQTGSTAPWWVSDFGIWFRVKSIIEKIFAKYTIISDFFDTAYAKALYVSGKRKVLDSSFLNQKNFDAYVDDDSDNWDQVTIPDTESGTATVDCSTFANRTQIDIEILDEGSNYSVDRYLIPETGVYRFRIKMKPVCLWQVTEWPLDAGTIQFKIMRRRSAVDTAIVAYTDTGATDTGDWDIFYELDTGYQAFIAGDEIWIWTYISTTDTNNFGSSRTMTVYIEGSTDCHFYSAINPWCLFQGIGDTVVVSDNMPDMTQLDFLRGLKHAFNLRFFFDSLNGNLYIEPADSFYTNDEYDLSDMISGQPVIKHFSVDYCKKIWLQWINDSSDKLHKDYKAANTAPPGYKEILFTNEYMKDELLPSENPVFSVCLPAPLRVLASSVEIISIYDNYDESVYNYPPAPIKSFAPRLGYWEGLTAGLSWYYGTILKTTYPKMSALDYATLYTSYFLKSLHYIDTGRMLECEIVARPDFINSLITVIGSVTTLGWKVKYKVTINGIPYYFILNRVVTDGQTAKLELILKQ